MQNKLHLIVSISFILVLSFFQDATFAADITHNEASASQDMLKIQPGMSPATLAGRPSNELVMLPSGKTISIGKLQKFSAISKKLRQVKNQPQRMGLKYQPAATGIQVKNAMDLSAALQRPDSDTVQLPSGKLVTVELLHYLQPEVERRIGHNMASTSVKHELNGKPIKVQKTTEKEYWKEILLKPDSTVLETPDGQRITVGELKQFLGGSSRKGKGNTTSPITSKQQ